MRLELRGMCVLLSECDNDANGGRTACSIHLAFLAGTIP